MPDHIKVDVISLAALLDGRARLRLPWFQRAYSWHEEHVVKLLTDVIEADIGPASRGRYHLGRIRLARPAGSPEAAVIDGHQRTMTLTILFALLRDMTRSPQLAARLQRLIGDADEAGQFHVLPQPSVAEFFAEHVQRPGASMIEFPDDVMKLSETKRRVLMNRDRLAAELMARREDGLDLDRLAAFLLDRCTVDTLEVEDEQEAWDLLETREQTGLQFHDSDRLKITLLSVIPGDDQPRAARLWETAQGDLGPDGMLQLLECLRTIHVPKRSNEPLEMDLQIAFSLADPGQGLRFLETVVKPAAEHARAIERGTIGRPDERAEVARRLELLGWLEQRSWKAPLLQWLGTHGREAAGTGRFLAGLERLAWIMRIAGTDPNTQDARYRRLIGEVRKGAPINQLRALEIEKRTAAAARKNLTAHTFNAKHFRDLVLRRLSVLLGADCNSIRRPEATIEHVLPRNPPPERQWWREFQSRDQMARSVNRLGNLAILPEPINQLIDTWDFVDKRPHLQESGFALARHAGEMTGWSAATIEQRTNQLVDLLMRDWDLPV